MKARKSLLLTLAAAFLLPLGLIRATPASAASDISISLSPGQQRITLNPGETVTAEVTVINSGTTEYEFVVYATPYEVAPDYSGNIFDNPATARSQISRWISFAGQAKTAPSTLAPNERRVIEFTINVPDSVPAGGQYAAIMAEVVPPPDAGGVVTVRRVASLLHAHVNGNTLEQGAITERVWRRRYASRQVNTSLTIANTGNTDFVAENSLIVQTLFGRTVSETRDPAKLVFPDTSRTFELNWQSKGPVGIYKLTQQSTFLGNTISATRWIVLIPVWLVAAGILTLVVTSVFLVFGITKLRRRRYRD
ncbi:DUF916 domain-containing protein [Candidatus Saccharibacteria bacterium]|nr:DUF916 domain-containing protein [Candidatus Saccharibacteria bacterium]